MWKLEPLRGLRIPSWFPAAFAALCMSACSNHDMYDQPKFDPLEQSLAFPDSQSARGHVPGTVSRVEAIDSTAFPMAVSMPLLEAGKIRYQVYCAPCHGAYGYGNGIITRHGFPNPPSFHLPRLLEAPDAHFYGVITHGFGRMYPYAYRVAPADRWAIIAYVRALQLSRNARLSDVPPEARRRLEAP